MRHRMHVPSTAALAVAALVLSAGGALALERSAGGTTSGTRDPADAWRDPAEVNDLTCHGPLRARVSAAGVGMRAGGTGTIDISGIPAGATIVGALLYWASLDTSPPDLGSATLDGVAITSLLLGSDEDVCWGLSGSHSFRALVTSIVRARPDPNGSYDLAGFPTACVLCLTPETDGATLAIVWRHPAAPNRLLFVCDGIDVTDFGGDSETLTISYPGPLPFPLDARLTMIVGDGQGTGNELYVNGALFGVNVFDASDGDYWDTDRLDVSGSIAPGDTALSVTVAIPPLGGDCTLWTASILDLAPAP